MKHAVPADVSRARHRSGPERDAWVE